MCRISTATQDSFFSTDDGGISTVQANGKSEAIILFSKDSLLPTSFIPTQGDLIDCYPLILLQFCSVAVSQLQQLQLVYSVGNMIPTF
jgi:hypothetical protein